MMEERVVREVVGDIEQLTTRFRVTNWVAAPEPMKKAMVEMFRALGMPLRFCRFDRCGKPIVQKDEGHAYCCSKHKDTAYNQTRGLTP